MPSETELRQAIDTLAIRGLNLFSIVSITSLPERSRDILTRLPHDLKSVASIILVGHAGPTLWNQLTQAPLVGEDPIDEYSRHHCKKFANDTLGRNHYRMLYPGESPLPLQQLGEVAGWHSLSPLGLGIHPTWGLWFAYRCLLISDLPLPPISEPPAPAPCDTCNDKPCIQACMGTAFDTKNRLEWEQCMRYRLTVGSSCRDQCLSRLACPVGLSTRYCREQIAYHYNKSLEMLRRYQKALQDRG